MPNAGNTLTIRQYQTRWLATYQRKLAHAAPGGDETCATTTINGNWALPVPANVLTDDNLAAPHHDYPAWDLPLPEGTPIYAITAGDVIATQHWNGNWWRDGCDTTDPPDACNTCGNGITIHTTTGLRHTYCHNQTLHVALGDTHHRRPTHRRLRRHRPIRHPPPPPRITRRQHPTLPPTTARRDPPPPTHPQPQPAPHPGMHHLNQ